RIYQRFRYCKAQEKHFRINPRMYIHQTLFRTSCRTFVLDALKRMILRVRSSYALRLTYPKLRLAYYIRRSLLRAYRNVPPPYETSYLVVETLNTVKWPI